MTLRRSARNASIFSVDAMRSRYRCREGRHGSVLIVERPPGAATEGMAVMEWKLEVVVVPVTDIDRAKSFYVGKLGFHLDADTRPTPDLRVVHMTPPGSACSVVVGPTVVGADADLGSGASLQLVVDDIEAARAQLA